MQDFARCEAAHLQSAPKNFGVRFVCAELTGDEHVRKIRCNAQVVQNEAEPAVEVRKDTKRKLRLQLLENANDFWIQFPDVRLGKMFIGQFEKIVPIKFIQSRYDIRENSFDQLPPPVFIVIFPWPVDR